MRNSHLCRSDYDLIKKTFRPNATSTLTDVATFMGVSGAHVIRLRNVFAQFTETSQGHIHRAGVPVAFVEDYTQIVFEAKRPGMSADQVYSEVSRYFALTILSKHAVVW